mmetsp:Transcript_15946/g.28982  ORF Transcript_15946/g.28982 Transcript_15946/m.28982 type:complete len:204 (-) Transcript_15946:171-782(-)
MALDQFRMRTKCSIALVTSSLRLGVAHDALSRSILKLGDVITPSLPPSCCSNQVMSTFCCAAGTRASARGLCLVEVLSSQDPVLFAMTSRLASLAPTPLMATSSHWASKSQKYSVTVSTTLLVILNDEPISVTCFRGCSTSRLTSRLNEVNSLAVKTRDTEWVLLQAQSVLSCSASTPSLERQLSCEARDVFVMNSASEYLSS